MKRLVILGAVAVALLAAPPAAATHDGSEDPHCGDLVEAWVYPSEGTEDPIFEAWVSPQPGEDEPLFEVWVYPSSVTGTPAFEAWVYLGWTGVTSECEGPLPTLLA